MKEFMKYTPEERERILVAREMAGEGMVLLENSGILPFKPGAKVAVFGTAQINFLTGGSGSGATESNYTVTLPQALMEAGAAPEPGLLEAYTRFCAQQEKVREEERAHNMFRKMGIAPDMPLDDELVGKAAEFTDTAILVISRMAGEGEDRKPEKGDYYLSDLETDIFRKVRGAFKNLVVILNIAGIIHMDWVDIFKPEAVIISWLPGQEGAGALADILMGKINPSGRLADTIAFNLADHPSTENFGSWIDGMESYTGDENQIEYWGMIGNHSEIPLGVTVRRPVNNRWYTEYQEGIYVGYRYFTTFGVPVRYPFGFGLSYTTFDIKAGPLAHENGRISFTATVKNTGNMAGKQVVQVYCRCGGEKIERPDRELVAFKKTELLQPGASCRLKFEISEDDLACYSEEKAAWLLEAGTYELLAGANCLDAVSVGRFEITGRIVKQVQNHFALNHTRKLNLLSKRDLEGTAPKAPPLRFDRGEKIGEPKPPVPFIKPELPEPEFKLEDVYRGKATLEQFMAQMDDMELVFLCVGTGMMEPLEVFGKLRPHVEGAGGHTATFERLGIPSMVMSDGPAGIAANGKKNKIAFPTACLTSCSWNVELSEKLGEALGGEAAENGVDVLLGPAMNIHRNPLGGRNYEYFSEDPHLSGKMAAAVTRGIQKHGVMACLKHFAVNNQETNRFDGVDAVANERTIREIYLKGFEIAVRGSRPGCIMTSYNSINGAYASTRRDLVTDVLRGEWGFEGFVVTDWEGDGPYAMETLQAGNDLLMPGFPGQNKYLMDKLASGQLTRETFLACAENILKAVMRSNSFKKYVLGG
ncbi:MAG: glycoside hydrolase family 3 N-terminal domain-containing protein [Oscillospiraceae bacterium]